MGVATSSAASEGFEIRPGPITSSSSSTTARPTARPSWPSRFGARVLRNRSRLGPAAARNAGALAASAPWIFFLDADVAVHPDAHRPGHRPVRRRPRPRRPLRLLRRRPAAPGLVSRFRNLLHHYVHQSGAFVDDARPAHTFWTGCGLIRRDVFLEAGGFDPQLYRRPAIEDIELGYRITRAGHRIVLARDVQATHLKRWTLFEMIRTDIFRRGVPWMLLMKRSRVVETDLNVSKAQRACVAATGLGLLGAVAALRWPWLLALLPASLAAIVALNRRLLPVPRPSSRAGLRGRLDGAAPALLLLLRGLGRDRRRRSGCLEAAGRADGRPPPGRRLDLAETVASTAPHTPRIALRTEPHPMNRTPTVAVVRSDNRRGAVAEALALIADDLRGRVTPEVLIKANLRQPRAASSPRPTPTPSPPRSTPCSPPGPSRVVVAEGASDASAGFDRFGYRRGDLRPARRVPRPQPRRDRPGTASN